jgi:hypothetical protein
MLPSSKPEVRIENWQRVGHILTGNVYDHPRFLDGTFVYTSRIMGGATQHVETMNTVYKLGTPAAHPQIGTVYAEGADEQDGSGI